MKSQASETWIRQRLVEVARAMSASGLSPGRSGNLSCRFSRPGTAAEQHGMLITPTALAYNEMTADDIAFVDFEGRSLTEGRAPSSEWPFHAAAYVARPDVGALVHTHSDHATVLACAHLAIPAFHYMVARAGGNDIPCVPYATFGTSELARHVASGLNARDACLLANHGVIAVGDTLDAAFELAEDVEMLATLYVKVRLLDGAHILPDDEMSMMVEKFKAYGRNALTPNDRKDSDSRRR